MDIMLLWSRDGQDHTWPVIPPEGMSKREAWDLARKLIHQAQEENPDEWNQTDIEALLKAAGFQTPNYYQGPLWD